MPAASRSASQAWLNQSALTLVPEASTTEAWTIFRFRRRVGRTETRSTVHATVAS